MIAAAVDGAHGAEEPPVETVEFHVELHQLAGRLRCRRRKQFRKEERLGVQRRFVVADPQFVRERCNFISFQNKFISNISIIIHLKSKISFKIDDDIIQ